MKYTFYIALSLLVFASCQEGKKSEGKLDASVIETDNATNVKEPGMTFTHRTHDFGTITEGEKVEHTFKFENTGKSDLVISSCKASCGCTIPQWPKEPVAPGEEGELKVVFSSAGKSGTVTKDVNIIANTNPPKSSVQIKVFVEKKSQP